MTSTNSWGSDIPVEVEKGGSGRSSHTAYSVITGGTTATGPQQSVASVGTSGQIYTSNGAGSLGSFQDSAGGGGSKGGDTTSTIMTDFMGYDVVNKIEPSFIQSSFQRPGTTVIAGHPGLIYNLNVNPYIYNAGWYVTAGSLDYRLIFRDPPDFPASADELWIGFTDHATTPGSITNGLYFKRIGTDDNWYAVCENGGTETVQDTGIDSQVSATWRAFEINVNTAGTSAVFKIDGATTNTITTNIPAASTYLYAGLWAISVQAGTLYLDAIKIDKTLTSRI